MFIEELSAAKRKLLPSFAVDDLTHSVDGELIFLTHVFKDGCVMGFWTHSPWGTTRDQEQGWMVLDANGNQLDSCETKTFGMSAGNNFKRWRAEQKAEHGKAFKLCPEWENSLFWKISEN